MTAQKLDDIILRIANLQEETGLFPSFRCNPSLFYRRVDTNVFFTAITVFSLQSLRHEVSPESRQRIDLITVRAREAYSMFQNKDGLDTYNFWPTKPSRHFPNGYIFRHFEHFRIPDDIDDTAMVYLTITPSADVCYWLKTKLAQHANGSQRQRIRNTFPEYRQLRAYSTWFGKNMGVDFDACALSNMLYCIYQYDLPRNQHDTDSLFYLRSIVETGQYKREPFRCAPHYAQPSLILYHLARLMGAFRIDALEPIKPILVSDASQLVSTVTNRIEQILLATSLARLGASMPIINTDTIEQDFGSFHFFIAGLLTAYEHPILRQFANKSLVHMRWQCEAHCWALVAEYEWLKGVKSIE